MRFAITVALLLTCAGATAAFDLGTHAGPKPAASFRPNVPIDRQGGDTILDATPISIPGDATGTTAGYNDDYDEICPYSGSTSPDVVYTTTSTVDLVVDIDLFGSTYDTKLYVYDENMALVACNDDYYPDYVSRIEELILVGGMQYFIVIDGWNGDFGDYVVTIAGTEPCVLDCPAGAQLEGEPPLMDDYQDAHNGGCNSPEFGNPFGVITSPLFCGVSGWYLNAGAETRDTDWFEIIVPEAGFLEFIGDAEYDTHLFELAPQDCGNVAVVQNVIIGPCHEGVINIPGAPGSTIWFWVGPTTFVGPVSEYDYVLRSYYGDVRAEDRTLSGVKALFR